MSGSEATEEDTAGIGSDDEAQETAEQSENGSDRTGSGAPLVDEITDHLADQGIDVYHGREFVSIRANGQLAPNSTVTEQYLDGKESVILAYESGANQIVIIPLEEDYDRSNVYTLQTTGDHVLVSASGFFKDNGIDTDKTVRYNPEWDENKTKEGQPGALVIDLDQDGEVAQVSGSSEDNSDSRSDS
jgi:hypothetical protein